LGLALAVLPCLILILPINTRKWAGRFTAVVVLLIVGLTCISCGGGGTRSSGATPAGIYTVVVAATSAGNAPQSIQLTVTVQ
jgi:hypothetical protein